MNDDPSNTTMWVYVTLRIMEVLMQLGYLAVALTTVRRASVQASNLMVLAGLIRFASMLISPVLSFVMMRLSPESFMQATAVSSVVLGLLGMLATALFLVGIVRLAEVRRRSHSSREP